MLDKLFESLDEKVFTADLKESLTESFNKAVSEKAEIIAEELLESRVEAKAAELVEAKLDELDAKAEELTKELTEAKDAEIKELREAELATLHDYLDRVVEKLVTEATDAITESITNEKADLMVEAFDAMLLASGVTVKHIQEASAVTNESTDVKLTESIAKYDALIEENIALEKEVAKLHKEKMISEATAALTLVESEKVTKLAAMIEFTNDESYKAKLATLVESISKEAPAPIVEKVEKRSYSHLV